MCRVCSSGGTFCAGTLPQPTHRFCKLVKQLINFRVSVLQFRKWLPPGKQTSELTFQKASLLCFCLGPPGWLLGFPLLQIMFGSATFASCCF